MSFDLDQFITDCQLAVRAPNSKTKVSQLLRDSLTNKQAVQGGLSSLDSARIDRLYVASDLTVLNVVWAPKMTLLPHNHNMWAVIGVYAGREDNIFWRRVGNDPHGKIEAAGATSIGPGEVRALGKNLIHSVTNPTSAFTGAIHVYGGDFFAQERSEWDPQSLLEHPYDVDKNLKLFTAENAILGLREKTQPNRC
jgi:predicted metal-dependent enzyme (double-stranded beta helix superfamily)